MQKHFYTYEISLALKKLGFDEPCICGWINPTKLGSKLSFSHEGCEINWDKFDLNLPCPLWQQAIDWFYNIHNIEILYGFTTNYKGSPYMYDISKFSRDEKGRELKYLDFNCQKLNLESKEMSREQGILKAIEIIKSQTNETI